MVKINSGQWRNRAGERVNVVPNTGKEDRDEFPWISDHNGFHGHYADGTSCIGSADADLMEPWSDSPPLTSGPVRTVTRREVVPGVWSGVTIEVIKDQGPCVAMPYRVRTADELRAAAAVLLELAGALPDGE